MDATDADLFLKRVMNVEVLRAGGAAAGVFGSMGADNEVVNNLKLSSLSFANEYRKPKASRQQLQKLADEIYGSLQILQLTHTLSEQTAQELASDLQELVEKRSSKTG